MSSPETFSPINTGYNTVFKPNKLSIGLVVPIETYANSAVPTMQQHIERVQLAETLGFSAVWLRDVLFNVPSFGDAGQVFDPFVYLGALAMQTHRIALGVASIVLPLRHPAHVAKAAATADVLSNGRLILGIASGDRPEEYPALNLPFNQRGTLFQESYDYIRKVGESTPQFSNAFGSVNGSIDMLPKPIAGKLPLLVTGFSQQTMDWVVTNGDGWMTYPRAAEHQARFINEFRDQITAIGGTDKPIIEPLYIDLAPNPNTPATPIHLGFKLGINALRDYLDSRAEIGVNHIALNLRFNQAESERTLHTLAALPNFIH